MKEKKPILEKVLKKSLENHDKVARAKPHRKLIFLVGFANVGKDTVCQMIKDISPNPVERIAFADALKSECYPEIGGFEYDPENEDRKWKDENRDKIIQYGEGQKHKHGMYYWIKRALDNKLMRKFDRKVDYPHLVITDCRRAEEILWFKHFKLGHFEELNEARAIYDPIVFAVHREGAEVTDKDYLSHFTVEYASECRVFTHMIKNYKGLKELKQHMLDVYALHIK